MFVIVLFNIYLDKPLAIYFWKGTSKKQLVKSEMICFLCKEEDFHQHHYWVFSIGIALQCEERSWDSRLNGKVSCFFFDVLCMLEGLDNSTWRCEVVINRGLLNIIIMLMYPEIWMKNYYKNVIYVCISMRY